MKRRDFLKLIASTPAAPGLIAGYRPEPVHDDEDREEESSTWSTSSDDFDWTYEHAPPLTTDD